MMGPKNLPTNCVPKRCIKNSTSSTATEIGTTKGVSTGVTISKPSTAPMTEMAGVMMLSP